MESIFNSIKTLSDEDQVALLAKIKKLPALKTEREGKANGYNMFVIAKGGVNMVKKGDWDALSQQEREAYNEKAKTYEKKPKESKSCQWAKGCKGKVMQNKSTDGLEPDHKHCYSHLKKLAQATA